jgi:hypothetical protein
MSFFDRNGDPTPEFLDSDAYYDDVAEAFDPEFEALGAPLCDELAPPAPLGDAESFDADGTLVAFVRRCRKCGCTDERACITAEGPCHWVAADLCSACDGPLLYGPGGEPLVAA